MTGVELKHLRIRDVGDVAVIGFVDSGLLYAADLVQDVGVELKAVLQEMGRTRILLDFDDVQYVSSTMLAQLAHLDREVRAARGELKICGLGPILQDTFRIGRFDSILDTHVDEASALRSFRKV